MAVVRFRKSEEVVDRKYSYLGGGEAQEGAKYRHTLSPGNPGAPTTIADLIAIYLDYHLSRATDNAEGYPDAA